MWFLKEPEFASNFGQSVHWICGRKPKNNLLTFKFRNQSAAGREEEKKNHLQPVEERDVGGKVLKIHSTVSLSIERSAKKKVKDVTKWIT